MFLILWGPGDENDANYIKRQLDGMSVLTPATSVAEMSGLINNCNFIIANQLRANAHSCCTWCAGFRFIWPYGT